MNEEKKYQASGKVLVQIHCLIFLMDTSVIQGTFDASLLFYLITPLTMTE